MDLSSIEQIIRTQIPNAQDNEVELYLNSVKRDMGFGADYSNMSEDDIVEDFEFYIQSKMDIDEAQKPSMKMKKSELKEMIKAAFLSEADFTSAQDDDAAPAIAGMYDPVYEGEADGESAEEILARITGTKVDPYLAEAEGDEEEDVEVDAEEETTDGGEEKNDSIVVDKKIVSLSSLPSDTRKILDSLETLRAQAEEFGDQKFITQVGNTITFFTRDFVVAGDEPTRAKVDESLEILKMRKLAGLLTEGEYTKALLREMEGDIFDYSNLVLGTINRLIDMEEKGENILNILGRISEWNELVDLAREEVGDSFDYSNLVLGTINQLINMGEKGQSVLNILGRISEWNEVVDLAREA
jgi:hypothetical protein